MIDAVTRQAEVIYRTDLQHARVCGAVGHMTDHAAISLDGSVFERERTLLIGVTLETRRVGANRQPRLF
jgi:hypothetical protein